MNKINIVCNIINRYEEVANTKIRDRLSMIMDLEYSNINLDNLLVERDCDFVHDMVGLYQFFDRGTKSWTDCFVPRCGVLS